MVDFLILIRWFMIDMKIAERIGIESQNSRFEHSVSSLINHQRTNCKLNDEYQKLPVEKEIIWIVIELLMKSSSKTTLIERIVRSWGLVDDAEQQQQIMIEKSFVHLSFPLTEASFVSFREEDHFWQETYTFILQCLVNQLPFFGFFHKCFPRSESVDIYDWNPEYDQILIRYV